MKKLSQQDIDRNTFMYDEYHRKYNMEDGWFPENKYQNYELLCKIAEYTGIPLSGTNCLDVGCGTGDFSEFLRKRGIKKYFGIDIYTKSLVKARKRYPDEMFIEGDFLQYPIRRMFDYAFCSGALTVKLPTLDKYDFLETAVAKMWKLSRIGVAFNVLIDGDPYVDPGLSFFNREKVEEVCKEIAQNAEVFSEKTPKISQIHVYMVRNVKQIA